MGSNTLAAQWRSLWESLSNIGSESQVFQALRQAYETPPRAYHNLTHIAHCLDEFQSARHLASNPQALEWALWFHDSIYDSKAKDNEQQSAELAARTAVEAGLPSAFTELATRLILATKHTTSPEPGDETLITDIDLAILGQPPNRFDEYEHQIREEYDWVDHAAFAHGRSAVLASFLARPTIYQTEWFQEKYEEQARKNIARALEKL